MKDIWYENPQGVTTHTLGTIDPESLPKQASGQVWGIIHIRSAEGWRPNQNA